MHRRRLIFESTASQTVIALALSILSTEERKHSVQQQQQIFSRSRGWGGVKKK